MDERTDARGAAMTGSFAALTDRDTYRGLLFLGSALPFGILWLLGLTAGWALAVTLAIPPVGVLVVIGFGVLADLAARAESATARRLLGVPSYPARHRGGLGANLRPLTRARAVVTDTAFWNAQAYLVLRVLAGMPVAVAVLSLVPGGLFLITSPIHHRWIPQGDGGHGVDLGIWVADTLPETLPLVAVGLAVLVLTPNLAQPLTAPWRRLTYRLLGGTMTDDYLPLTEAQLRRGLVIHGIVVGAIGALLVTIWALTTRSYFWPMWPLLALSLPLAIHAWTTLVVTRPERVPARLGRDFAIHAGVTAALAIFLTLIWTIVVTTTAGGGYYWPIWPILGLAVVLLVHLAIRLMAPAPGDAELKQRIDVLTTTRAGAVDAQEQELRRIERDLHDGAQARLVALGMNLGMAEQKVATDPDQVRQLIVEARQGAREALEELRDLARGIHPPILADRGLGAAVSALAARSPVRVNVSVEGERPPPAVESAAYFVAAEALANAGKHAEADHVDVQIVRSLGQLVVQVTDDGRGGADPAGSGLVGLRRRVEALDGRLEVVSPDGGPTTVRAELPCE
jgi:signal transduction histidine kinase